MEEGSTQKRTGVKPHLLKSASRCHLALETQEIDVLFKLNPWTMQEIPWLVPQEVAWHLPYIYLSKIQTLNNASLSSQVLSTYIHSHKPSTYREGQRCPSCSFRAPCTFVLVVKHSPRSGEQTQFQQEGFQTHILYSTESVFSLHFVRKTPFPT